jgi:hypothetical protein
MGSPFDSNAKSLLQNDENDQKWNDNNYGPKKGGLKNVKALHKKSFKLIEFGPNLISSRYFLIRN